MSEAVETNSSRNQARLIARLLLLIGLGACAATFVIGELRALAIGSGPKVGAEVVAVEQRSRLGTLHTSVSYVYDDNSGTRRRGRHEPSVTGARAYALGDTVPAQHAAIWPGLSSLESPSFNGVTLLAASLFVLAALLLGVPTAREFARLRSVSTGPRREATKPVAERWSWFLIPARSAVATSRASRPRHGSFLKSRRQDQDPEFGRSNTVSTAGRASRSAGPRGATGTQLPAVVRSSNELGRLRSKRH